LNDGNAITLVKCKHDDVKIIQYVKPASVAGCLGILTTFELLIKQQNSSTKATAIWNASLRRKRSRQTKMKSASVLSVH
jgi:hypothetical protein